MLLVPERMLLRVHQSHYKRLDFCKVSFPTISFNTLSNDKARIAKEAFQTLLTLPEGPVEIQPQASFRRKIPWLSFA